jgi:hypothetical protein
MDEISRDTIRFIDASTPSFIKRRVQGEIRFKGDYETKLIMLSHRV